MLPFEMFQIISQFFTILGEIHKVAKEHAGRVLSHMIQFDQSFTCLENNAKIVNSTPNASIRIPTTKYKLKKIIEPQLSFEYHVRCANCKKYSVTFKSGHQFKCDTCSATIGTSNSEFFIYIPLERQIRKMITDNFEEVCSYPAYRDKSVIADVHDCIQYQKVSQKYYGTKILSLTASTDGVALFNSSRQSLWAIQLYAHFLKPNHRYIPRNMIVVALYVGKEKPNMHDFFCPLMKELRRLNDAGGISIEKNENTLIFMPVITHCCCDLPAKAEVQGMVHHAGHYACGFCFHPGISVKKDNKSKPYIRYVDRGQDEVNRTHESFLKSYTKLGSLRSIETKGVKSISCLSAAKGFDLTNGFSIDYMHCILLGIMNRLFDLWLNSVNHKQPYYIKRKSQDILKKRILSIKPTSEITRKPRSITERADFKANELRSLLLYYLRFSLSGLLNKRYIDHFHLLSSGTYILLKESISREEIDIAEKRLIQFSDEFEIFYGKHNVTINVHLIKHIGTSVRNLGPLWAQSAFGMEANNGVLNKITAKNNVLHSIAWKYVTRSELSRPEPKKENENGEISVGGKTSIVLSDENIRALSGFGCQKVQTIYRFIFIHGQKYTSENSKKSASTDFFVKLKRGTIGAVKFYFVHELIIYGFIEKYEIIENLDQFDIVQSSSVHEAIKICNIETKLIYMKMNNKEIITSIPNRFEKT